MVQIKNASGEVVLTNNSLNLLFQNLKQIYKGISKIPKSSLEKMVANLPKQKKFMLRGHERASLGTGLFVNIPKGFSAKIIQNPDFFLKRGLQIEETVYGSGLGLVEVCITVYNTTPFLNEIRLGEKIAKIEFCLSSEVPIEIKQE